MAEYIKNSFLVLSHKVPCLARISPYFLINFKKERVKGYFFVACFFFQVELGYIEYWVDPQVKGSLHVYGIEKTNSVS